MAAARFDTRQRSVPHPLREKMTLFWHGLLASSLEKDQIYCNHRTLSWQHLMFRRHAVGPYRTLLDATSRDPAMLLYLDNWISTVDNPNENYARELLELFSLGVGNYGQTEVLAAARAGTGYGLARNSKENKFTRYQYSSDLHDHGNDKEFFGIVANWDLTGDSGDPDARNLVAYLCSADGKGQVTARMLSRLLWEYFAHFAPDDALVEELASAMTASGQVVILDGLRALFTHDHFYSEAARLGKVKNPIEWAVMVLRALSIRAPYFPEDNWDPLQQGGTDAMGLHLFFPASVFGWWRRPETHWIGMSPLLAKSGVIDALGYRLQRKPKHAVWKLLELAPDEMVDGLYTLFGVDAEANDPSRTAALELLRRLRAEEVDRVTLAVTLLKFIAVSPAAQVN
jgi:uncharacterized protein (DUF1800 family)